MPHPAQPGFHNMAIGLDVHAGPIPIAPMAALKGSLLDFLPYIGKKTLGNGMPLGDSGTSGIMFTYKHIGTYFNALLMGNDTYNFFGGQNTYVEGSRIAVVGYMVLDCNDSGLPLVLPSKMCKPGIKSWLKSAYAPTGFSLPLISSGAPIICGDEPVVDWLGFGKGLIRGWICGKIFKRIGKSLYKHFRKLRYILYKKGFTKAALKCKLFGDPVDAITGRVVYAYTDFELPGPLPLQWQRTWHSDSSIQGLLGHGNHFSYDLFIEEYPKEDCLAVVLPDGRAAAFPLLALEEDFYHRPEQLTLKRLADGSYSLYNHKEKLTYHYNLPVSNSSRHCIQTITNHLNHTLQFKYNNKGHLHKIIDSAGRHLQINTDQKGLITAVYHIPNPIQHTTYNIQHNEIQPLVQYSYNDQGDLITITDALNQSVHIKYENHLMIQKTDREGQNFYWKYEQVKTGARCIHTWGDGGILEGKVVYHKGYNEITNSLGKTTLYYYNEDNLCTQIIDAEGHSTIYEYTEYGELYRIIDPEGNITGYHYDEQGRQIGITYPDGSTAQSHYDEQGNLQMTTDIAGNHQVYTYDEQGRLKSSISVDNKVTLFQYNEHNLISQVCDAETGAITQLAYDEQYNLHQLTLPNNTTATWVYDSLGRCITAINPTGAIQSFSYDALNRIKGTHMPDGNALRLQYNAYDEVVFAQDNHHKIKMEYTPLGSLKMREQNGKRLHYNYNTEDELTYILNERGERYSFGRNNRGEVIRETGFDGINRQYHRSPNGNIIRTEKSADQYTTYEYDVMGNLIRLEHSDGYWETFNFNKKGQLIEATNEHCTVQFEVDKYGRILKETTANITPTTDTLNTYTIEYTYDQQGHKTKTTSSLGATIQSEWQKNSNTLSASQGQQSTWQAQFMYNKLGIEIERILPGGINMRSEYDVLGRLTNQTLQQKSRTIQKRQYQWTPGDRLATMINALSKGKTNYGYDDFGNLAWASYDGLNTLFKTHDEVGNIYQSKDKKDRTYDKGGKLLKTQTATYHYDIQGNLIHKNEINGQQWKYEWNAHKMLTKVIRPDYKAVQFTYDALGRRIEKIYEDKITRWLYDGNTPLHEWSYALKNKPQAIVDEMGQLSWDKPEPTQNLTTWVFEQNSFIPAAKLQAEKQYSIICDQLGTPTAMYDALGQKIWEMELDIYGNIRSLQGKAEDCPFRYQGQYHDMETGLYYNRFRYYSPEEGIYLSQDPIRLAGGLKLYSYVHDNNTFVDALGLAECKSPEMLYRFDRRPLQKIKDAGGFHSRGDNMDLYNHVINNMHTSGYIATSRDPGFIPYFLKQIDNCGRNLDHHLYIIKNPGNGIDVAEYFSNNPHPWLTRLYDPIKFEIAVPKFIPYENIFVCLNPIQIKAGLYPSKFK